MSTWRGWSAAAGALLLAACASSPPTQWYALPIDAPVPAAERVAQKSGDDGAVWALSPRVSLPGALDRDTLVVASGNAGLQTLTGHRWAEPLRDSVPRLLLHDLALLRGAGRVWMAPVPAGVTATRQLRVEIAGLQAASDRRTLRVVANWWLVDITANAAAPVAGSADFTVPIADASNDALASAHRLALWRLAEQINKSRGDQ